MIENNTVPDGYMQDSKGRLVPKDMVRAIDSLRNETVSEIVMKALELKQMLSKFKASSLETIESFATISAQEYDAKIGGIKGNVSLTSYDGKYKVQRSNAEYITFDERLQVAKELIDNCINRWAKDARSEIRVLVQDAFQTDKTGKINTARVLGLKRLDISDAEWQKAMQAINDSIQVSGSRTYIRIYERVGMTDEWRPISLDLASV